MWSEIIARSESTVVRLGRPPSAVFEELATLPLRATEPLFPSEWYVDGMSLMPVPPLAATTAEVSHSMSNRLFKDVEAMESTSTNAELYPQFPRRLIGSIAWPVPDARRACSPGSLLLSALKSAV